MLLLEVQSRIDELQIGAERLKEKGMVPRVSLCYFKGFSLSTSAKIVKIFTFS